MKAKDIIAHIIVGVIALASVGVLIWAVIASEEARNAVLGIVLLIGVFSIILWAGGRVSGYWIFRK